MCFAGSLLQNFYSNKLLPKLIEQTSLGNSVYPDQEQSDQVLHCHSSCTFGRMAESLFKF